MRRVGPIAGLTAGGVTYSADGTAYVDVNPGAGTPGSTPGAKLASILLEELTHLVEFAGLTPSADDSDLHQVRKSIAALIAAAVSGIDLSGYASLAALAAYARLGTAQSFTKAQRSTPVQIVDGASPAIDLSLSNVFYWTLGGNRTVPAPSNAVAGQSGVIWLTQDGTGSRTLAYNTFWKFAGGTIPTASTAASAKDCLVYEVSQDGTFALCALSKGAA